MGRDTGHVVVTGASSGIGLALAKAFATDGNRVTLVARRRPLLEELAAELNVPTHVVSCDLTDLAAATAWVDEAESANGPVDVLINNAGMQYVEPAAGVSDERAERLLTLNLLAPMRLANRVLPEMRRRKRGTIAVISSLSAFTGPPGMAHYNCSKAALSAFFETLRVELADSGVNVVNVYPGPVATPMERAALAEIGESFMARRLPTGTPEELALRVRKAIRNGRARLVYPRAYTMSRYAQVTSQWLTNRFAPKPGSGTDT